MSRFAPVQVARAGLARIVGRAREETGGSARLKVVALFAAVYGLNSADTGTVGSIAPQLERSLGISNTQIGLIVAVASLAGAIGTVPAGVLTDRISRLNLLAVSIVLWSAAMVVSGFATSFTMLVLTRVGLGAVTATSGPAIASLTGDFFPARERARMLGLILTGELLGAGVGVVVSGDLSSALSWRWGFAWLAIPGLVLAVAIRRLLVEPARGGQSRLEPGAEDFVDPDQARRRESREEAGEGQAAELLEGEQEVVRAAAREQHIEPRRELVLHEDPRQMTLWRAVRYVLRVPTNLVLIVSTALAYIFFAGIQTFAVELMRSRYHLSEATATAMLVVIGLGALGGIVASGHLADRWLRRGRLNARVVVAAICYIAAAILFVPALLSPVLVISLPLFFVASGALAAPDPVISAARLDIMHPWLWGRAEGVRTVLYMLAFAAAPLLFGFVSDELGAHDAGAAATGHASAAAIHANGSALAHTFLIMLVPVAIAGAILLRATRTYPRDVATAVACSREAPAGRDGSRAGGGSRGDDEAEAA